MAESKISTSPGDAYSEASAVLEGKGASNQSAGSPSQRDSVSTLPFQPAGAVSLGNFDMLASLREAEQFALVLKTFADMIPDPRWQAISKAMDWAMSEHDKINATPAKT